MTHSPLRPRAGLAARAAIAALSLAASTAFAQ